MARIKQYQVHGLDLAAVATATLTDEVREVDVTLTGEQADLGWLMEHADEVYEARCIELDAERRKQEALDNIVDELDDLRAGICALWELHMEVGDEDA